MNWLPIPRAVVLTAAAMLGLIPRARADSFTLADIQNWTGTGTNQAGLVIDWNDGKTPESIAWGYRWNDTATGLQMLQAIDAADPRLTISYSNGGAFVFSIGYDLNGNGGTFTPGTPGNETGSASDSSDHYQEGLFTQFWGYMTSSASPYGGSGTWAESGTGAGGRHLANGAWDGWSLSTDEQNFTIIAPGFPTAAMQVVPEPSAAWWLGSVLLGGAAIARRRRCG